MRIIDQNNQWMFHVDNKQRNLPYINSRHYKIILQILNLRKVEERILRLVNMGFEIKRCYVPNYNGVGNVTYMPKLNEIRMIIGRPKNHFSKEVYAIIFRPNQNKEILGCRI